jgi:hypothetical protein
MAKTKQMSLKGIPISVHKKIVKYGTKRGAELGRKLNVKESYVEFLTQMAREVK